MAETKSPYVTSEQLGQVADAVKKYIDKEVDDVASDCPSPAESSAITAIVNKFNTEG